MNSLGASVRVYAYNHKSRSAKVIALGLGAKRIKPNGSTFKGGPAHTLINWGSRQQLPEALATCGRILNSPDTIRDMPNKLFFFEKMSKAESPPRIPEWTRDPSTALDWLENGEVLGRADLTGRGGDGIIFGSNEEDMEEFIECPLFVKYVKKKEEYRVHFIGKDLIDIQQKLLRKEDDQGVEIDPKSVDFRIRNYASGFIFARGGINPPEDVVRQATKAYKTSGIDFGAVDVIYNAREGRAYVLEINTAPGLMGTTGDRYVEGFRNLLS